MKVITLVENTEGAACCKTEHGLSFLIRTDRHKVLMDTGADKLILKNAKALGVTLSDVDTIVLSHGHYDHGGGLPYVMKTALRANVYLSEHAFGSFYSMHSDGPHFIGISEEIENDPGIQLITESREIDEELFLLSDIGYTHPIPSANERLMMKTEDGLMPDRFDHEICLVVSENHHRYLFSGCAHHGILNILDRFQEVFGSAPEAVFSGFHMMKKQYSEEDLRMIQKTAEELCQYPTRFYTCHCTGEEPYQRMKEIMKDQLSYLHCGDSVTI